MLCRLFLWFCRCFTEGSSLFVYLGGLCARGDLKRFADCKKQKLRVANAHCRTLTLGGERERRTKCAYVSAARKDRSSEGLLPGKQNSADAARHGMNGSVCDGQCRPRREGTKYGRIIADLPLPFRAHCRKSAPLNSARKEAQNFSTLFSYWDRALSAAR